MAGRYVVQAEFPFHDDGAKAKEKADELLRDLMVAFDDEDNVHVTYERKELWNHGTKDE